MLEVPRSPDLRPYVSLAPYDRAAVDIALTALADMAAKLPGVTLREHMTEVLTIETLAAIVAELGRAVDRVPDVVFEAVVRQLGVDHDTGAPATATVTFTVADDSGHTVPAGTEVVLDTPDGPVLLTTDTDLAIEAGLTSGTVAVTATQVGDAANGVEAGTPVRRRSAVPFVVAAELASPPSGGRPPETDDAYFSRAAQSLARLTSVLVVRDHFRLAALGWPGVARAHAVDLYEPGGTPGSDLGHLTVFVWGHGGPVDSGAKADLEAALGEASVAGLSVHVTDATVTPVDVEVQIVPLPGTTHVAAIQAVTDAISSWLSPASWEWEPVVRFYDVVHLIEDVPGVSHIVAGSLKVDNDTTDVALGGVGVLPTVGTLTVTVP